MKATKHILLAACLLSVLASCDTDVENKSIQNPYTYSDQYYQNLRDFKKSDHSISFMWFAQWGGQNSMATRFIGLPDSLDLVSIWGGGIPPKENTQLWEDLRFTQKVKGTRMLFVMITRLAAEDDSHDFKAVYNEGVEARNNGDQDTYREKFFQACDMYADYFADQVFENDLDGFDIDNEPEGDPMTGEYFMRFVKRLAMYMGPNPDQTKEERRQFLAERYGDPNPDVDKLLCVDGRGPSDCEPYMDYYLQQNYGGGTSIGWSWATEKCVLCENVGDNWTGDLAGMYRQARYQPAKGRKGGFGAFYGHRDYTIHTNNQDPYARFRECIQIQNPAIY